MNPRKERHVCQVCRLQRVKERRHETCSPSCAMKLRHARAGKAFLSAMGRERRAIQRSSYLKRMAAYFRTELRLFEASADPQWKVVLLAKVYQQGRKDQASLEYQRRKAAA